MEDAVYGVMHWISHGPGIFAVIAWMVAFGVAYRKVGALRAASRVDGGAAPSWALPAHWLFGVALCVGFVVGLGGVFHIDCARTMSQRTTCLANVKAIGLALLTYAKDYDERLPPANHWSTVVEEDRAGSEVLRCPVVRRGPSYGMNRALAGTASAEHEFPSRTVQVFEANTNASSFAGGRSDLAGERHTGGTNIGFADGHAMWCNAHGLQHVLWDLPTRGEGAGQDDAHKEGATP